MSHDPLLQLTDKASQQGRQIRLTTVAHLMTAVILLITAITCQMEQHFLSDGLARPWKFWAPSGS